ncbi:Malate/lactate/ureidoglycolate dehydrogenase, LDH2 family [Rhizobiales bacterium GAS188]|nr:Malate/lactate/ureidoglycolate dehydrogenase, LDH2 family [Rhizobiales bacterium GAS188]
MTGGSNLGGGTDFDAGSLDAGALAALVGRLFRAVGLSEKAAALVAETLVDADLSGQPSHGVMLVDMYLDRLRRGSVSPREEGEIVVDRDGVVVLDAQNGLGQLIGDQAMALAVERARLHGSGIVAVRHGFHFGVARRYAVAAADAGCIGIAMCNTRPLMPAPGGAERVVGNNPIAIAVPTAGEMPIVLDMATSEAAMGKIRMAAKSGHAIPPSWAVKADGSPTTDAEEAIKGMLLPSAGPKGFGLAFMIDLMSGLLSGGAHGDKVKPLYGDPAIPYDCSSLFIAIDVPHFRALDGFEQEAEAAARRVREGRKAPGVEELHTPGAPEWTRRRNSKGRVRLDPAVLAMLGRMAGELGIDASGLQTTSANDEESKRGQA